MYKYACNVSQISMNARAVVGVNEVNCLGMLGCDVRTLGQLLIGVRAWHVSVCGVCVCVCVHVCVCVRMRVCVWVLF